MPVIALAMAAACSSAATIKNAATAPSSSHSSAGNMRPFEERCAGRTSGDYMSADGCRFDLHDGMSETPYFATRSDAIDAEAKKALDLVAKIQKKYGFRFNIVGHAANCDSEAANQSLSLRRAENVKSELLALGVRDDQIVSVSGMGSTQSNSNTPPSCADHFNDRVNLDLVDLDQRTSPP